MQKGRIVTLALLFAFSFFVFHDFVYEALDSSHHSVENACAQTHHTYETYELQGDHSVCFVHSVLHSLVLFVDLCKTPLSLLRVATHFEYKSSLTSHYSHFKLKPPIIF
ncbi:MAG: hypothetical protein WCR69_00050 [Sulfuricurvum sp.]